MTRAQRWAKLTRDAQARKPAISFSNIEVFATPEGVTFYKHNGESVAIPDARIPTLTKFLHEYFVRRDK